MTWPAAEGAEGLQKAIERICHEATDAVLADQNILILSDRMASSESIAIPAALATAAVHPHLIRQRLRLQPGLVIETRTEERRGGTEGSRPGRSRGWRGSSNKNKT